MTEHTTDLLKQGGLLELQAKPGGDEALRLELRALAQTDLYFLVKGVLAPYTPGYDPATIVPHIHGKIARFCGQPPAKFSMLLVFRGARKSTIGTVGSTVQAELRGANDVLIFSEASLMAEKWSREARKPFEGDNKMVNWLFPELVGGGSKAPKWGDAMWTLPHGGTVQAAGLDTQLMGAHVDYLFMDDIFSDPKADKTPEYAERILQWVKMSRPLLKNQRTGVRRLTGVPWWLSGEPYAYFRAALGPAARFEMPLIDEQGVCMWPEAFDAEAIEELRADPFVFASQYMLSPVSQETAIFKRGVVHLYDEKPTERNYTRIMTYDPAFTTATRSHSNAFCVADVDAKGGIWIEHAEKKKIDAHAAKRWAVEQALKHHPRFLGIECNGPQRVFFEEVKRELLRYPLRHKAREIALVELKPTKDKVARWQALASGCASGQVRIQRELTHLVSELYRVTGAKHEENDLTDAAAHLIGAEMSKKKPMKLTEQSEDAWLPWALRDEKAVEASRFMAM